MNQLTNEIGDQRQIKLTINKPTRVLHFSDGVEEEIEESHSDGLSSAPSMTESREDTTDPKALTWGPWFSYYASKSGNKVLNAVDYAGESLASFFGITTPKYQIEIDEYERMQSEKKKLEEESVGWVPKNGGGDIPLVLNEPSKGAEKPENV